MISKEGTGHRTISEEQNNDKFDIFPINDPQSNDNAQEATGCLLHEINPIAPQNRITDIPHENIQHQREPLPIPADIIHVPQII